MNKAYAIILHVLNDCFGILIVDSEEDFSIRDYVADSISLIQFVLAIEKEIGKELPDDFLIYDILDSAKGFAEKLDYFIETDDKTNSSII